MWKYMEVPFFMAYVKDKPKDAKLEDLPELLVARLKETQVSISILKQIKIKLSDGTDAMSTTFKWRLEDRPMPDLHTASVMAIKGDIIISVSGTSSTLNGYNKDRYMSLDEMMKYCMTLKLNS